MQPLRGGLAPLTLASGKPFAPSDLANLALWLKADALSLNDGDAVSSWTDSSGANRHATATTTARPTYKSNIVNSKPVLRFNGTSNYMVTPAVFAADTQYTVFIVSKAIGSSLNAGGRAIATIRPAAGAVNGYWHHLYRNDIANNARILTTSNGNAANIVVQTPSTSYPFDAFIVTSYVFGTNGTWWINNAQKSQALSITTQTNANAVMWLGKYFDTTNAYWLSGDIAEVIVYGTALSDGGRGSVQTYLATKYGITLA